MSKIEKLAAQLLRDRERLASRERERRDRPQGLDFDPYSVRRWRVIAGGDPGFLPTTPMRKGSEGFYIACRGCGDKFESKGWAYCAVCMDLPAEERHALQPSARACAAPGCEKVIAPSARADARYCSGACRERARQALIRQENGSGPLDIADPPNLTDTSEITQRNQGPKTLSEKSRVFDLMRGDRQLSKWEPTACAPADDPGWDIPEFLRSLAAVAIVPRARETEVSL